MLRFVRERAAAALAVICAFVVVAAVALGFAGRATATAGSRPYFGIYECMGVGEVQIPAYFELMGRDRYISALQLYGRKLEGATAGRWRKRGNKIIWRTGVYGRAGLYGVWWRPTSMHPKGYIAMYLKKTHQWTEITCYPNLDL